MERQPAMAPISRNPSCCYIADDDDDDDDDHHHPPPRPSEWFNRSLDDMEAGFSHHRRRPFLDSLFRRETRRYEYREPHFLDSCYLCKNTLRNNKDIFMYRGDTPFCSEDCRQEQIELDQQMERNTSLSSSVRVAMRNKGQQGRSTSPSESPDHPRLRTDTVAVA